MEYLITPPEPTDWKINESDFINHLLKHWSDIQIKQVVDPDDYYSWEWSIKVAGKGQRLDGALHRDGEGISLDGYLSDCAFFALWFRSLVPQDQRLLFYDQGFNYHIDLQIETTASEIIESFLAKV